MQTTLLGLGILIILALVAALGAPYFIDVNEYRGQFETHASRVIGAPVRIAGPIAVRLLPTPSLNLRDVQVGDGERRIALRELGFEFALGSLMRGEIRAADMVLTGPEFQIGLDADGQVDLPKTFGRIGSDTLSIERLFVRDGRIVASDASSDTRVTLEKFWFSGEIKSLLGPLKGEGGFSAQGSTYAYRVGAGRMGPDGMRLRASLDLGNPSWNLEAEGALGFERQRPSYDGSLVLARTNVAKTPNVEPLRITTRVKANPASALFEQIEFQYGPDERPLRLTGAADLKLGKNPFLDGVLSARQLDLDRVLALPEEQRRQPTKALRALFAGFGDEFKLPFHARLGLSIDNVTLAGGTLTGLRSDIMIGDGIDFEKLELRAPGQTDVRLSGQLRPRDFAFQGPVAVDVGDPRALTNWLEGRTDAPTAIGSLSVRGDLTVSAQAIALERLHAELDRKSIEGRVAYKFGVKNFWGEKNIWGAKEIWGLPEKDASVSAELRAQHIDLDNVMVISQHALPLTGLEPPKSWALILAAETAQYSGVAMKQIDAAINLDKEAVTIERMTIGDLGGANFEVSGQINSAWTNPHGAIKARLDAGALDGLATLAARFVPDWSETLLRAGRTLGPAKLNATLDVVRPEGDQTSRLKLGLSGRAGPARVNIDITGAIDAAKRTLTETEFNTSIESDDGRVFASLLGLESLVAIDAKPGSFRLIGRGAPQAGMQIDGQLATSGFDAIANGTLRLTDENPHGALDVALSANRLSWAALSGDAPPPAPIPATIRARLVIDKSVYQLEDLSGSLAGTAIHGRIALTEGAPWRLDGRIESESFDLMTLAGRAIGAPVARADDKSWPSLPFGTGLVGNIAGRLQIEAGRATLAPHLQARQARATLRLDEGDLFLDDIDALVAGGRMSGALALRRSALGLNVQSNLTLSGAEIGALLPAQGAQAIHGRCALQLEVSGSGRSPVTLTGALSGTGLLSCDDVQIARLDPQAFEIVSRAADGDAPIELGKVQDLVGISLDKGKLSIPKLEAPLAINSGQIRAASIYAPAQNAALSLTGTFDLAEWLIDVRLRLTGPPDPDAASRPDLLLGFKGPPFAPVRSIDASALTGWLTLRAVDRQAKRLQAIEADRQQATSSVPSPSLNADHPSTPAIEPDLTAPNRPPRQRPGTGAVTQPTAVPSAPTLPPPTDIKPSANPTSQLRGQRPNALTPNAPRPEQTRPLLEQLFGR